MDKNLKKISVSDKCVACGSCIVNSKFMIESDNGYAIPKDTGLITYKQYEEFKTVVNDCPVNAILVQDNSITVCDKTNAVIELKNMINKKIKNYKIPYPNSKAYDFHDKNYEVPPLISEGLSKISYKSYNKAINKGFDIFKNTMYSQHKALTQAICIEYKIKQLKKFAYYEKEKGNYYYDNNMILSNMLQEAVILGQAISGNILNIPSDFCNFEIGPDKGFDGDIFCWTLRNLEKLSWDKEMENADYYKDYIDVESYGNEYKYSLYKIENKFRQHIIFELSLQLPEKIDEDIKNIYENYCNAINKTLSKKLSLLKTELKKCINSYDFVETKKEDVIKDINTLLNEVKSIDLKQENLFHYVDSYYDSSFRFSSYNKAHDAARNRIDRFYKTCSNYLDTGCMGRISEDLSENYQKQFEKIINKFKTKLQEIFDKYNISYPNKTLYITCDKHQLSVCLSDYDNIKSYINWDIRDFIDNKVIAWNGVLNTSKYFTYSDIDYRIDDLDTYEEGFFGDKKVTLYAYTPDFRKCEYGFEKAVNFCCDYVFKSDYLNMFKFNMLKSLEKEVNEKVLGLFK